VKARVQFQASHWGFVKGKIGARRGFASVRFPISVSSKFLSILIHLSPSYMILAAGTASLNKSGKSKKKKKINDP